MSLASVESSPSASFSVEPLQPFGAKIRGIDLAQPIDADTVDRIKAVWAEHLVLVLPGQSLSEEQQIVFTRNFGELAVHGDTDKLSTKNPNILRITNVREDGATMSLDHESVRFFTTLTAIWHTDGSYKPIPSMGSALHALEVPPEGGETWFCNMFMAYDALPAAMKARIEGLHMVHYQTFTHRLCPGLTPYTPEQEAAQPPVSHPLVRHHADGRRSLYITGTAAYFVSGMPIDEGEALHKELLALGTKDDFVYRHKWTAGDIVMWDNRPTMHRATRYDGLKYRRAMQRTEITGWEPVL